MLFNREKSPASLASPQVVIVDDEEDLCRCLRWGLDQLKITSAEAHDGEDGMTLIRQQKPKLILLDIKMPRKNGYQVLTELQQDPELRNIPVFVMTSLGETGEKTDEQWARSLGVVHFVSKPFQPEVLAQKIADHLSGGKIAQSNPAV